MEGTPTEIEIVNVRVALPSGLVAVIAISKFPNTKGVPEIFPFEKTRPTGRPVAVHESAGELADSVKSSALYPCQTLPLGRSLVKIEGADS